MNTATGVGTGGAEGAEGARRSKSFVTGRAGHFRPSATWARQYAVRHRPEQKTLSLRDGSNQPLHHGHSLCRNGGSGEPDLRRLS